MIDAQKKTYFAKFHSDKLSKYSLMRLSWLEYTGTLSSKKRIDIYRGRYQYYIYFLEKSK